MLSWLYMMFGLIHVGGFLLWVFLLVGVLALLCFVPASFLYLLHICQSAFQNPVFKRAIQISY